MRMSYVNSWRGTKIIIKDVRTMQYSLEARDIDVFLVLLTVFKNLDDPNDKTFEPENSPIMELEYPNNHACER